MPNFKLLNAFGTDLLPKISEMNQIGCIGAT